MNKLLQRAKLYPFDMGGTLYLGDYMYNTSLVIHYSISCQKDIC